MICTKGWYWIPYDSVDKKCIPYYGSNITTIPHYILSN